MAGITGLFKAQFFDSVGAPLVLGKVYTYSTGTSTPLATYTDSGAGTQNSNPVILDPRGEADIWLDTTLTYRFILATAADVPIWTVDGIRAFDNTSGSISFIRSDTGATSTDLQTRGRLVVYANDFGSKMVSTPGSDINLAITAVNTAGGGTVVVPAASYTIETTILQKSNVYLDLTGATLTAATGLNAPVIKNSTAITEKTITGITNVARVATATCTAHGYVASDLVHISGATPDGYNGWHKVITAPTADTFTYYVDKNISADSGTIKVCKYTESNIRIIGGKIVGDAANTTGDNNGVRYTAVKDFQIEGLTVDGTYHTGVQIISGVNGRLFRVRGDNVIHSSHNGIVLGGSSPNTYADNMELVSCQGNANGQDGIICQIGTGQRLIACGGEYNVLSGIKVAAASGVECIGCWGRYNTGHGYQFQGSGGNKNITVMGCDFTENAESGMFLGNIDTVNPALNISIIGNQCHRNGQVASSTNYGIAFEPSASTTLDRVVIQGNQLDEQGRGLSFSASGTMTNFTIIGNRAKGNTSDIQFGALDLTTLTWADNDFADFTDGFSFTPVLTFDTAGDLSVVYSQRVGRYVKDGDKVTVWVNIVTSTFTHTTASGQLKITGLPFAALTLANFTQLGGGLGWQGITKANYTDINPFMTSGNSFVNMAASGSGQALAVISTGDMPTGGTVQLTFQLTYRIALP